MNAASGVDHEAIAERLAEVRERIATAAARSGREPDSVRLVVVTKDVPAEHAAAALEMGALDLGENRAQELLAKMDALSGRTTVPRWHFIGTLQRNKVKTVTGAVAVIHSIDSVPLGRAVSARAATLGARQDVLLEVNTSGERSKHGFDPAGAAVALEVLAGEPGLQVRGLMTIAPAGAPSIARRAFAALRELRDDLRDRLHGAVLEELSMGMTSDFEQAIEEGSTIVRVGTAIFGERR